MIRWQYTTLTYAWDEEKKDLVWGNTKELVVNAETVDKRLNELGKEGWELLCIEKLSDVSHIAVNFYLKLLKEAGNHGLSKHRLASFRGKLHLSKRTFRAPVFPTQLPSMQLYGVRS